MKVLEIFSPSCTFCHMLTNLSALCVCPKRFDDTEFKSNRLIWQREFQDRGAVSVWFGHWWRLLVKFTVSKEQKGVKNVQFGHKRKKSELKPTNKESIDVKQKESK